MNNSAIKELCLKFAFARNEEEVKKIIESNPILSDSKYWHCYDLRNNIGTVTAQSPKPVPSLIEKITNANDSILLKKCREYGDIPDSKNAAKSMEEGILKYAGINDAIYQDMHPAKRKALAENIQIIADGYKQQPNIIVYDNGEGQNPQNFPNTFLSIGRENKIKIFFVQGKYNQGGTAVLPFCGKYKYQFILSKRYGKDSTGKYGFALIRRNRGDDTTRSSFFEYCVDEKGLIFEFDSEPLDLGLANRKFDSGSFLKLYNYDLKKSSNITLDLFYELNLYLHKSAFPVLIYEKRDYKGHSPTKVMHGNKLRLQIDNRDSILKSIPMNIKSNGVDYPIEIYVFQKDTETKYFNNGLSLIFTVNGQVQHSIDTRFTSQKLKKAYLKKHIFINVDCSHIPRVLNEDIFMASRAAMRECKEYQDLLDSIIDSLKNDDFLTNLDEQWRKQEIYQNPKDDKFLKSITSKLLKNDENLLKLLHLNPGIITDKIKKINNSVKTGESEIFKGERFPALFKFKNIKNGKHKMLPQNGTCNIKIETDVENEYLLRDHDKGELKISIKAPNIGTTEVNRKDHPKNQYDVIDVTAVGPNEGCINVKLKPNTTIPVGSEIPIDISLTSPDGELKLSTIVEISNPNEKAKTDSTDKKEEYTLPELIEVYKSSSDKSKSWSDMDPEWNDYDVCKVIESSSEGSLIDAICINMDNKEVHDYIRSKKITGKAIEVVTRTYKTSVFLLALVQYYELYMKLEKCNSEDNYAKDQYMYDPAILVADQMKGIVKLLLNITTNESIIKEIENVD